MCRQYHCQTSDARSDSATDQMNAQFLNSSLDALPGGFLADA
jgi:hypothetical protein